MRLNPLAKANATQNLLFVYLSFLSLTSVTAQYVANTKALIVKEIEHLYFDAASAGILTAITPCSNYYDPSTGNSNNALGRNTAAEWIRTAFRKSLSFHQSYIPWDSSMVLMTPSLHRVTVTLYVKYRDVCYVFL